MKLFYGIAFIALMLVGVKLSNIITKRFKINRWLLAFSAPCVIIVPMIVFDIKNPWILNLLIIIFSIMCIMFFEISKGIMEQREKQFKKYRK
jgi:fucose permease